jgi:hypothetical protein
MEHEIRFIHLCSNGRIYIPFAIHVWYHSQTKSFIFLNSSSSLKFYNGDSVCYL